MASEILTPELLKSLNIHVRQVHSLKGPPDAYKHDSGPPRGAIFIANYRKIRNNDTRQGSEIDVVNLINLFSQMGYKTVEGIQDLSKTETIEAMKSFRGDKIHEDVDSMVLIVMSHGIYDNIFITSDEQSMTSSEVYEIFSEKNCPALKGKPKFFLFQHCRGTKVPSSALEMMKESVKITEQSLIDPSNTISLGPVSRTERQKKDKTLSDMILLYSTLSGEVSLRHKKYGSPYIHQICRVFMKNSWQSELGELLNEVEAGLSKYQGCEYKEIRKKKDFYFNPKPINGNAEIQMPEEPREPEVDYDDGDFDDFDLIEQEMNPPTKKYVLLINNLDGCEPDMVKLKYLFSNMGYTVIGPKLDVTFQKIQEVISEFKDMNHGENSFIIFYGDGFNDYIVTADHYAIHFKDLQRAFNDTNCPNLSSKPKVFITNLCYFEGDINNQCSGNQKETDSQHSGLNGNNETSNGSIQNIPAERDMFFINVEVEGSRCENGSVFTEALYQVLMENNSEKQLIKLMRDVSERLDALQDGTYICELRTIKFPPEFSICRIKLQTNQT